MKEKIAMALLEQYKSYIDNNPEVKELIKIKPDIIQLDLRTLMNDLNLDESYYKISSPLIFALKTLEAEGFIIDGSNGVFGITINVHGDESKSIEARNILITDKFIRKINNL
ncbi:hypothetical protein [Shewanella scandinavica]|uniref:hypothetical protein n=1 Tax=Shewanella scandinavica TaxID=3063538 RepID=UPI0031872332